MLPRFLVEDGIRQEDGFSEAIDISTESSRVLLLTLGITRIIEQESLDLAIYGSEDGSTWSAQPVLAFPQKFYCGVNAMILDLSDNPAIRFVRMQWKMSRWGRGVPIPLFSFYVFAEAATVRPLVAAAAGD